MEAALLFPLVILIIVAMVGLGFRLCEKVETSSAAHSIDAHSLSLGGKIPEESVLRGKWYLK